MGTAKTSSDSVSSHSSCSIRDGKSANVYAIILSKFLRKQFFPVKSGEIQELLK